MSFEHSHFQESFLINEVPNWRCPHCERALLKIPKGGFVVTETYEVEMYKSHPEHEPEWDHGFFNGKMICTNRQCQETIFISGKANMGIDGYYEIPEDQGGPPEPIKTWNWYLFPRYFSTPINVFEIHHYYPKSIRPYLEKSFELLWVDSASCANKIRSVVEKLLDEREIKKYSIKNGKENQLLYIIESCLKK